MAHAFSRSLRSIETDGARRWLWVALAAVLVLGAWSVWFARAEVPLYASSSDARLVVDRAVHPIESPVAGRVAAVRVNLEDQVEPGASIVELDATEQRMALAEERARFASLAERSQLAVDEIEAQERALVDVRAADEASRREGALRVERLDLAIQIAAEESQRLEELGESGGVSKLALSKARSETQQARVIGEAEKIALQRLALDQRRISSEREATLAGLRRTRAEIAGQIELSRAAILRLEHEIDLRTVRAAAAGEIGELARLAPGSFVQAGQRLGVVLARGRIAAEGRFVPSDALGRVRVGQHGELRLDGFPWTQYGGIAVVVEHIAGEARDGLIRVEFALSGDPPARIPLEHGLPGRLEVEVDRASPLEIVLRSAGHAVARSSPPAPSTPEKPR
jgi:membrane fusion protein (multidrug efflux system)